MCDAVVCFIWVTKNIYIHLGVHTKLAAIDYINPHMYIPLFTSTSKTPMLCYGTNKNKVDHSLQLQVELISYAFVYQLLTMHEG